MMEDAGNDITRIQAELLKLTEQIARINDTPLDIASESVTEMDGVVTELTSLDDT